MKASTTSPVTAPLQRVWAPALRLRALRENEPPTGKPPASADTTLDAPWPTNSRSESQRRRSWAANVRAIEEASTNPTSAMITPAPSSDGSSDQGRWKTGSTMSFGIAPTSAPE